MMYPARQETREERDRADRAVLNAWMRDEFSTITEDVMRDRNLTLEQKRAMIKFLTKWFKGRYSENAHDFG